MARQSENASNSKSHIPAGRRRDKPQLSCNLCRRRKLRCDRAHPCSTCSHRGLSHSCTYITAETTQRRENDHQSNSSLHDRIAELEKLASSLANSRDDVPLGWQSEPSESADERSPISAAENLHKNLGRINLNDPEENYVESTHWMAVLDGISELKDFLDSGIQIGAPQVTNGDVLLASRPTLLSHPGMKITSHQELVSELPPKPMVDRLVVSCFSNTEVVHFLFHAPTFQKHYATFWQHPDSVSLMWLASLYGLMCAGTCYEHFASASAEPPTSISTLPPEVENQIERYRRKMIQCMILGGYTKGVPHTVETMLLYFQVEFLRKPDSPTEFWLLLGVVVSMAYRLGYHRDGSQFSHLTPFESEMRRRRWCSILQMDAMGSTQFGLPRMIDLAKTDVKPPRNLFDEDFDETTQTLPESRPITTLTPCLYLITKTKLFFLAGKIMEVSAQAVPPTCTAIMELDKSLDEAYTNLPPSFRMKSMTLSIIDKPELIVQRLWLQLGYHKNRCILHRRFVRAGRADKRWAYSRSSCIDSALQVLKLQVICHEECKPTGRLFHDRWRLSSLIMQEYLLATAVLCVDAYTDLELEASLAPAFPTDKTSRERILHALDTTFPIWNQAKAASAEAQKAVKAIQVVLEKASRAQSAPDSQRPLAHSVLSTDSQSKAFPNFAAPPASSRLANLADAARVEWQPLADSPLFNEYAVAGSDFATLFAPRYSSSLMRDENSSSEFQALDLMDVLQEDYPGMIL